MATVTLLDTDATTFAGDAGVASGTIATGELLVVIGHASGSSIAGGGAFTCTDNQGGTYTRIATATKATGGDQLAVYVRTALTATTASHVAAVSFSGDAATGRGFAMYKVTGMATAGASAVRSVSGTPQVISSSDNAAGTPSASFPNACDAANPIIIHMGCAMATPASTPPSGFTETIDVGFTTPNQGIVQVTRDSGFTGTTVTWGSAVTGGQWAILGLEFAAPALAASTPFRRLDASRGLVVR